MALSGKSRVVGIFGDPVDHSLSPAMHNAAFRKLQLDYVYIPFHVRPEDLKAATAAIPAMGVAGVNVTVPHKENILPFLDSLSPLARRMGAVNTVINRKGKLRGENTDVAGFSQSLHKAGVDPKRKNVILIGAGGASIAVLAALKQAGAREVVIVNRTRSRALSLLRKWKSSSFSVAAMGLESLCDDRLLSTADLIVNASSVGLSKKSFLPLDYAATPKKCLFFDLIPKQLTPFVRQSRAAGRKAVDGRDMLLFQGAAAFRLWTGQDAPLSTMRSALYRQIV